MFNKSLFIFRRDLRLRDNKGLVEAISNSKEVKFIFFADPHLMKKENKFIINFFIESLLELNKSLEEKQIELKIMEGKPEEEIKHILKEEEIEAIFVNKDYTPFSIKRDKILTNMCRKEKVELFQISDYLLNEPEKVLNAKNDPYTVFTPYYNKARLIPVDYPVECYLESAKTKIEIIEEKKGFEEKIKHYMRKGKGNSKVLLNGGRKNGMKRLEFAKNLRNYESSRDYPILEGTSYLSPYIRFGCVSIREVYHYIKSNLGAEHPLLRQLYWRDFFTAIGYFYPHVYKKAFQKKYQNLTWTNNQNQFEKWCEGKTGFPIVDAGMRELNETGYMHNRVRMITSSFLVKDLHINWQRGEKYFAKKLVDYDPAVNNGNWQWAASTGCDAQPYFRIFNPWLQQKKYDKDCKYIKKWVDELKPLSSQIIHKWEQKGSEYTKEVAYPLPLVNHKKEAEITKKSYKYKK